MIERLRSAIKLPNEPTTLTRLGLYMMGAYLFGVVVRLILYYQVLPVEAFWLNGKPLPIYSPDAGLYGFYAKQILSGVHYPFIAEYMPGYLIAFVVSLGFDIDWTMFLLPAFVAPLVVIPTVLAGHAIANARLGFFAALVAVSGINYYTRSYVGYMDTDVLNLFWPYMAAASAMMALQRKSVVWSVVFVLSLVGFYFWYHSSLVIIAAIAGMLFVVVPLVYQKRVVALVSAALVVGALFFVDFQKVSKRASDYYNAQSSIVIDGKAQQYRFANTLDTVAEAQDVNIFSIHPLYVAMAPYVLLATVGFVLLALAQPVVLLLLPLIGLGYGASVLGMRFTMFATPAYALGFVALFWLLSQWLSKVKEGGVWAYAKFAGVVLGVAVMLLNVLRVNPSFTPSFFKHEDVKTLSVFAKQSSAKDLLISWWDYGWPLWYYTHHRNTLVDNGRHGADTYLAANLLLSPSDAFVANAMHYFAAKQKGQNPILPVLAQEEDIKARFRALENEAPKIPLERDVYIMLHRDMLLTYQTLETFANVDLDSGAHQGEFDQIYISDLLQPYTKRDPIVKGDTFDFDLRNGMIKGHDGAQTQVHGVIIAENGKVSAAKRYNPRSPMNLIIYNKSKAIYLENDVLNTFLIKALLFDRYDRSRFEKVAETQAFKILKLKR